MNAAVGPFSTSPPTIGLTATTGALAAASASRIPGTARIGPILAVPGVAAAIARSPAPVVAVSPIVGGQAIKGPAAKMFASLGFEPSALAVARQYVGTIDGLVIDEIDAALAPAIDALGIRPLVTRTVMGGPDDRARLAAETIDFARGLAPVGSGA